MSNDLEILRQCIDGLRGYGKWRRGKCHFCIIKLGTIDKRQSFGLHRDGGYHCFRCGTKGRASWARFKHVTAEEREQEEQDSEEAFEEQVGRPRRGRTRERRAGAHRPSAGRQEPGKAKSTKGLPEGYRPIWREPTVSASVSQDARDYLVARRVTPNLWQPTAIGITYDDPHVPQRLIFPIKDTDGTKWAGYSARPWIAKPRTPVTYKYPEAMDRGRLLWNFEALLVETDEPVMVVEGVLDGLPYWPNAVATLGKPTHEQMPLYFQAQRPIVFALDGDAWRQGKGIAEQLAWQRVEATWIRIPPCEDPNSVDPKWLWRQARKAVGMAA